MEKEDPKTDGVNDIDNLLIYGAYGSVAQNLNGRDEGELSLRLRRLGRRTRGRIERYFAD